jgi:putative ABC transport system ATP-binding protein
MRTVGKELGITLIMVTHDLGVAEQAERVIRLEDGQVAEDSGAVSV